MRIINLVILLCIFSLTFSQPSNIAFSNTANFDRDDLIKANEITGYRLYHAIIQDKDSDALFCLGEGSYSCQIGRNVKYVVFSAFQNEVIAYLDSLWKYDFYYAYSKIVAHDLSSNFVLLEHDQTKAVTIQDYWLGKDTLKSYDDKYLAWDNIKHTKCDGMHESHPYDLEGFYDVLWRNYDEQKNYFEALYCLRQEREVLNCSNPKSEKSHCVSLLSSSAILKYNLRDYYGCIEASRQCLVYNDLKDYAFYTKYIYQYLMQSYFRLQKYDKAIAIADSMIKLKSVVLKPVDVAFAHKIKGIALINTAQKEKGCEELGLAVELGEKDALHLITECCNGNCSTEIVLSEEGNEFYNKTAPERKVVIIPLIRGRDELFQIEAELNGTIKLKFILDSGASDISLPPKVVKSLIQTGTVKEADFVGEQKYLLADGSTIKSTSFIIHKLKIGDLEFDNVIASIASSDNAPLLLGQSLLKKFGTVTLDYYNNKLLVN